MHPPTSAEIPGGEPNGLSLRRNISWTAIGNIFFAACQWGIISAFAKMGNAEMVGQFALALAIATPIALFFQFGLRAVLATDATRSFSFSEYLTLRLLTTAVAMPVTVAIAQFGGPERNVMAVVILITFERAMGSLTDIFFGAFQQRERMDVVARSTIVNGILSLVFAVAGVWVTGSLVAGAAGYLVGTAVPLFFYVLPKERATLQSSAFKWLSRDWVRVRSLFVLAFPLGISALLVSLISSIPRYVLEGSQGTADLGVFAALSYLLVAGTTVIGALGQSASPRLAAYFATQNYEAFWSLAGRMMAFGALLGLAGLVVARLIGGELLSLIYTPDYAEYVPILEVLALSASVTFAAGIANFSITAARRFSVQVPIAAAATLTCACASLVLIPRFGLAGAAWATMITSSVQLSLSLLVLRRATVAPARSTG